MLLTMAVEVSMWSGGFPSNPPGIGWPKFFVFPNMEESSTQPHKAEIKVPPD
jgi:hypothetical protein